MSNNFDNELLKKSIIYATMETFEEMTFIEVIEDNSSNIINIDREISVDIISPINSNLIIRMTEELVTVIAENVYSNSIAFLSQKDISDCIEELLNILTGKFLKYYFGREEKYKFEFPEVIINDNDFLENKEKYIYHFNAEGNIFEICFIAV